MITNTDVKTGIRYGIIPIYDVLEVWGEQSTPRYADEQDDSDFEEPLAWDYVDDEYTATQDSDETDLWVIKSPYYTRARLCSPCAPGAGDLTAPCEGGERVYCFGHEWFETGVAPYPVYSVETDELILPEKEVVDNVLSHR